MREETARRKMDKTLHNVRRDPSGSTAGAHRLHKTTRAYGKALIDSALEDMIDESIETYHPCFMCGTESKSMYCSFDCESEAGKLGFNRALKRA